MEKLILTDCDGCIFEWNTAFDYYMSKVGYERVSDTDSSYSLAMRFGISEKKALDMVCEFNSSDTIKRLLPYKDAKKGINKLVDAGFRFVAITSISDHPMAKINRQTNIELHFGDAFDDLICLPVMASKQHILREWAGSGLFWIEDHFKNAEAGHEVGLRPILIDTTYNSHYQTDLFPRVTGEKPWEEISNIILEEYGF